MAAATLDLSSITDALISALNTAIGAAPLWTVNGGPVAKFTITVSGQSPDVARDEGDCQLSLALVHLSPNASWRNQTFRGPGGTVSPVAPMALTLTYALAAFAGKDNVHEQQAMSVALAWIAANPIQRFTVAATPAHQIECTLGIESVTLDELARLWQSLGGAMRLTSLLRVSVIFLGVDPTIPAPSPKPTKMGMLVAPTNHVGEGPMLLAVSEPISLIVAGSPTEAPLRPGETALVAGVGLDGPEKLFLSPQDDSSSIDVTGWASNRRANTLHLTLPGAVGVPPAGAPAAGIWRLRLAAAPLSGVSIPLEVGAP